MPLHRDSGRCWQWEIAIVTLRNVSGNLKIPDLSVPDASQAYIVRMVRHRDCDSALGASNSYETYICDKQVGRHPQCYGWHQTVWAPLALSKQSS